MQKKEQSIPIFLANDKLKKTKFASFNSYPVRPPEDGALHKTSNP